MESNDAREYEAWLRNRAQALRLMTAITRLRAKRIRETSRFLCCLTAASRRPAPATATVRAGVSAEREA